MKDGFEMTKQKVQLRGGFSDRNKIAPISTKIQIKEFDTRTRNRIANLLKQWYMSIPAGITTYNFCTKLLDEMFSLFITDELENTLLHHEDRFLSTYVYSHILDGTFDEILTIVEFFANQISLLKDEYLRDSNNWDDPPYPDCKKEINDLFEQEFVGYRMIDKQITPIIDKIEVGAINQALSNAFDGPKSHIRKALAFLSDRDNPDYKNSIKESISAVESMCRIIMNDEKVTLGQAIKKLSDNGIKIHKSLSKAFNELYGYTSDEKGVRHSNGFGEGNVAFAETKYMLVTCCAFVNYLIEEYGKIKK